MLNGCYCVDLEKNKLEVQFMDKSDYTDEMKLLKTKNIHDLANHDLKTFESYDEAENFLNSYLKQLKNLCTKKLKSKKDTPKMLLKRKYIVTSLLNAKNYTTRTYKNNWKVGDIVQFYDQTYFLTCKITKLENLTIDGTNYFRYHYKIKK